MIHPFGIQKLQNGGHVSCIMTNVSGVKWNDVVSSWVAGSSCCSADFMKFECRLEMSSWLD